MKRNSVATRCRRSQNNLQNSTFPNFPTFTSRPPKKRFMCSYLPPAFIVSQFLFHGQRHVCGPTGQCVHAGDTGHVVKLRGVHSDPINAC